MLEIFLEMLGAFLSSAGFSMIFKAKKNRLFLCGLIGALGWFACCVAEANSGSTFFIYFVGAAFVTLFSEILARFTKVPATIYLIPGLLPMVPGGSLYYTTYALVTQNQKDAMYFGMETIYAAVGIAFGLVVISAGMFYYNDYKLKKAKQIIEGKNEKPIIEAKNNK